MIYNLSLEIGRILSAHLLHPHPDIGCQRYRRHWKVEDKSHHCTANLGLRCHWYNIVPIFWFFRFRHLSNHCRWTNQTVPKEVPLSCFLSFERSVIMITQDFFILINSSITYLEILVINYLTSVLIENPFSLAQKKNFLFFSYLDFEVLLNWISIFQKFMLFSSWLFWFSSTDSHLSSTLSFLHNFKFPGFFSAESGRSKVREIQNSVKKKCTISEL